MKCLWPYKPKMLLCVLSVFRHKDAAAMIQNTEPSAPIPRTKQVVKPLLGQSSPSTLGQGGLPHLHGTRSPSTQGQGGLPHLLWDKEDSPIYSGTRGTPPSTLGQGGLPHLLRTRSPIYSGKASHLFRQSITSSGVRPWSLEILCQKCSHDMQPFPSYLQWSGRRCCQGQQTFSHSPSQWCKMYSQKSSER